MRNSSNYIGAYSQRYRYSSYAPNNTAKNLRTVSVSVNDPTMGRVTATGMQDGVITARVGDTVAVTATPNEGYRIVRWECSDTATAESVVSRTTTASDTSSNRITVIVTGDVKLKAVFAKTGTSDPDPEPAPETPVTLPEVPTFADKVKAFLKKWWWVLAIAAYIVYKERRKP